MYHIILENRCRIILEMIVKTDGYIKVEDIAKTMNVSKRSVYYDIIKINDWLLSYDIPIIRPEKHKGIFASSSQKEKIKQNINEISADSYSYYVFSPEERVAIIVCAIYTAKKPMLTKKISELCCVSRNTVINDLKSVKSELAIYNLDLVHENKSGYGIEGNAIRKRAVFVYYLSTIIKYIKQEVIDFLDYDSINSNYGIFEKIEGELETEYVDGTLYNLAVLASVTLGTNENLEFDNMDEQSILQSTEYKLLCKYVPNIKKTERLYFALQLLGSRVQVTRPLTFISGGTCDLQKITENIVQEFEQIACLEFNEKERLVNKLYMHLSISLYRYKYGIVAENPLAREIETYYPELFHITRKVSETLAKTLGYAITKSEIAYLTLHFGSHLRKSGNKKGEVKILLVCPNGVSTAYMLKKELEDLSPVIKVIDTISLKELNEQLAIFDIIVSTVEIKHKKHVIIINPILTPVDKQVITACVSKIKGIYFMNDEADKVFNKMKKYLQESNSDKVYDVLKSYFD